MVEGGRWKEGSGWGISSKGMHMWPDSGTERSLTWSMICKEEMWDAWSTIIKWWKAMSAVARS